ncbi:hypothetical protein [Diadegma fenestrale ichnovirus]|nr:hypothetical protein [Diadegma fenestrale ichnovirus]
MVNICEMDTNTILNPTDMDLKLYMPRLCRLYVSTKFVLPVGSCNSYILFISKTPNARLQPTCDVLYRIH